MPKVKISEYSATANSNTDVASINIDEGCAPSGINNAIRAIMGHLKDFQQGTNGDPFNGPHNGTVGATTPSTGAFTTVQIGTNPAGVSIGVLGIPNQKRIYGRNAANSADVNILYVDGSNGLVFGPSDAAVINSSGNLGLGVTPSAWNLGKVFEVGNTGNGLWGVGSGDVTMFEGGYYNSGWKYAATSVAAARYEMNAGVHQWYNAPSGTAGNAITFTQAMTLDASGNLGIGTTSPSSGLVPGLVIGNGTSNQGITLWGTTSTQQNIAFTDTAGAQQGLIQYDHGGDYMRLFTASSERARIDSSGNLLVGKTSTSDTVIGTIQQSTGRIASAMAATVNGIDTLTCYSTGAAAYRFYVGMGGTVYATNTTISSLSDQRHKENIRNLNVGLAEVMALKPRLFDWKEGKGADIKNARGFIAQEFEEVFPDLIDEWKDPAPEGEEPYKSVRQDLIPVLVKAIQEQQALITQLTARITALESA